MYIKLFILLTVVSQASALSLPSWLGGKNKDGLHHNWGGLGKAENPEEKNVGPMFCTRDCTANKCRRYDQLHLDKCMHKCASKNIPNCLTAAVEANGGRNSFLAGNGVLIVDAHTRRILTEQYEPEKVTPTGTVAPQPDILIRTQLSQLGELPN